MPDEVRRKYEKILSSSNENNSALLSLLQKEVDQIAIELITVNVLKSKVQQILTNPSEFSLPFDFILSTFKTLSATPNYFPIFITVLSSLTTHFSYQVKILFIFLLFHNKNYLLLFIKLIY